MNLASLFEFRQPRLMYHGTSSVFLRTILKQGIVPDPRQKRWATDDQENAHSFNRSSLPGSYWTSNLMTARSSASNTIQKFGGEEIIVIAQIAEQSAYADEDNINGPLLWAMGDTVHAFNPGIVRDLWLILADDLFGPDPAKRNAVQEVFIDKLHQNLKGDEKHAPNRQLANELLDTLVLRNMAFEKKRGLGDGMRHWVTHMPPIPSIPDIEQKLLHLRDRLTRSYRSTARYNQGDFNHTLRTTHPVTYRGANRILWLLERPWRSFDQPLTLLYGSPDLPADFLNQYRERIGSFPGLVDRDGHLLRPPARKEYD